MNKRNLERKPETLLQVPYSLIHAGLKSLDTAGVTPEQWNFMQSHANRRSVVAQVFAQGARPIQSGNLQGLSMLFGRNFIGPDAHKSVGVKIRMKDLPRFAVDVEFLKGPCPFEGFDGKRVFETHLCYLDVTGNSIQRQHSQFPEESQPRFKSYDDSWYRYQDFFQKESADYTLWFIYTKALPKSFDKSWDNQVTLMKETAPGYVVPEPHILTNAILLNQKQTSNYLFGDYYVRTDAVTKQTSLDLAGHHVYVDGSGSDGLRVGRGDPGRRSYDLGLAVARKCRIIVS